MRVHAQWRPRAALSGYPGGRPQNQNYDDQFVPPSPVENENPSQIVAGFLTASASFVGQQKVAREYLTPDASRRWKPGWSATVYKNGPNVESQDPKQPAAGQKTASVTVSGAVQAILTTAGAYAVASETPKTSTHHYELRKYDGQWRISNAYNNPLLLTSTEFGADYQLANLYFFDPSGRYLVPDPVYVPLQATQGDLVNGLVRDLITQPSDWLGPELGQEGTATHTAFPKHTTLQGAVTVDGGTASVNLTGTLVSKASRSQLEQISAQLLCTLSGACQGQQQQQVKSIALYIDGNPFVPPGASGNPVQNQANQYQYRPAATPQAGGLYYLTASGQLAWLKAAGDKPVTVASIGSGYSSLAVSPDGKYLAVIRHGNLYTGVVGDAVLQARGLGNGITSLSWDSGDDLWVVNSMGVSVLRATPGKSATPPVTVNINPYGSNTCGSNVDDVTALRVAPDGVRVAIVFGGTEETLAFGAVVRSGSASQPLIQLNLSPFFVCKSASAFTSLSWYGADDVVALGQPGDTVTDYPVNGGTPTTVQGPQGAASITATAAWGLVAGLENGKVSTAATLSSAWDALDDSGMFPALPG